jgi:hypothetical protein
VRSLRWATFQAHSSLFLAALFYFPHMPLGIVEPTIAIPAADPDYSCHGSKVDALLSHVIVACLFGLFLGQ